MPGNQKPKNGRLEKLLRQVEAFAKFDFRPRGQLSGKGDEIDALVAGLNTLGEELTEAALLPGAPERIVALAEAALKLVKGDYDFKLPVSGRGDEIDAASTALNTLAEELSEWNTPGEENAALLAAIVSSSQDSIISKTIEGIILTWNRGAERLFGYPASEAIGKHISLIIPGNRMDEEKEVVEKILDGQIIDPYESIRIRKDGSLIHVVLSASPIKSRTGNITGVSTIARDITGQKHAEEDNARLASLVNNSQDAIISKSVKSIIQTWNKGAERIFGYTAEEAIGRHISVIIPADRLKEESEIVTTILNGGVIDHYETIRKRKDGKEINVSLTVSPILNKEGRIIGISKIARDITERIKGEADLQKKAGYAAKRSNELLDVLLKLTMMDFSQKAEVGETGDEFDAIAVGLNTLGEELEANLRMIREKEEKQAQLLQELQLTTEQIERKNLLLAGMAEMNDVLRGIKEVPVLAQDAINKLVPYLNAQIGSVYLLEGENTLRWTAGYAYSRREVRQPLIHIGEGLAGQAALEKKSVVFSDIPQDYLHINSTLGGTSPKSILAFPLLYSSALEGVIEIGSVHGFSDQQVEYVRLVADAIGIAFNAARVRAKMKDLLEETQRQAEELASQQEELQQTNEELEEKASALEEQAEELEGAKNELETKAHELELTNRYKSDFLSTMSHELRTPLNSILILARILWENKNKKLGSREVEYARNIHDSGTELLELINDILDLAKIESGKTEIEPENVALQAVVEKMNVTFREVARSRSIGFTITHDNKKIPRTFITDRQRLEQILKNLLSNAFKFTEPGGSVELRIFPAPPDTHFIRQDLYQAGSVLAFAVSDTGIGIPEDKQALVFEAFRQADSSTKRKYGGSGLGLSISKELAGLLGGELQLKSQVNKGSTFTLYLPAENLDLIPYEKSGEQADTGALPEKAGTIPAQDEHIDDDRDSIRPGDRMVLIIEDDLRFAKLLLNFVRERQYKGIVALQGNEGVSLARTYRPDAILLDMKLPVLNGEEVLKNLKNDSSLRHIPVQIISGYDKREEGMKLGAFSFIKKPVKKEDLRKIFDRIEEFSMKKMKKLLVIEDNKKENLAIRELVGADDVKCYSAHSAKEALKKIEKGKFDCIILDLGLPDMSGIKLLEKIRKKKEQASIPVIVYTGKDLNKKEYRHLDELANTVVLKTADSSERLLDETSLFLHRVESGLPKEKKNVVRRLHRPDEALKGKKVLIVDDDMRNVYALANAMEEEGIQYYTAENGKEALEVLGRHPGMELVLMDLMMPEMDGFEATARIRKMEKFKKLPIIALTAKAMKGMKEKCLAAGMSDYIAKPIDTNRLFSLMRVWLFR